ncbi:hypothetical protein [Dapis sp. BLCC M229]|uniref:hypothetical protein n=1 Tax=Dapis sp. BLCC M229 TaxID=3400188 RepID=UPI003CED2A99
MNSEGTGNLEECSQKNYPLIFLRYLASDTKFLVAQAEKVTLFSHLKSLKHISVNAFRFNRQALTRV